MDDIIGKIAIYFHLGLSQREILTCLRALDDVDLSLRILQRLLKSAKLYRRKFKSDILEVALFLELELGRYGKMYEYKMMHLKCIQEGFVVSQETIRLLLHILDPDGIFIRQRKTSSASNVFQPWSQFYVAY